MIRSRVARLNCLLNQWVFCLSAVWRRVRVDDIKLWRIFLQQYEEKGGAKDLFRRWEAELNLLDYIKSYYKQLRRFSRVDWLSPIALDMLHTTVCNTSANIWKIQYRIHWYAPIVIGGVLALPSMSMGGA